jgi:hypothetical protein
MKLSNFLLGVSVILALGGLGGCYYLYGEIEILKKDVANSAASTHEALQSLSDRIDTSNTDVANLKTGLGKTDNVVKAVGSSLANLKAQTDNFEKALRDETASKLSAKIVDNATEAAIGKVLDGKFASDPKFLATLAGMLAKNFADNLKGSPGDSADPAIVASLLVRNPEFLDAVRTEIVDKSN